MKNKWHCASSIAKREKKDTLTSICSLLASVPSINAYIVLSLKKANKETKLAESEPADTFLHRGVWTPSNSSVNWSKAKVLYHVSYCQDDLTRRECVCNTVLSQGTYKGAYIHILLIRPKQNQKLVVACGVCFALQVPLTWSLPAWPLHNPATCLVELSREARRWCFLSSSRNIAHVKHFPVKMSLVQ